MIKFLKQLFCTHSYAGSHTPFIIHKNELGIKWGIACIKCGYIAEQVVPNPEYYEHLYTQLKNGQK